MKLSAVVVAYNPTNEIFNNIKSFGYCVDQIFLVNNGGLELIDLSSELSELMNKIIIIDLHENLGIAKAINIAAKQARLLGSDYLLTMDQDSIFSNFPDFIKLVSAEESHQVAIYTPAHITGGREYPDSEFSYIDSVMTSGNIINLSIFDKLNGLDEDLFIDRVDHDYCATVIENNFLIKRFNKINLIHGLGSTVIKRGIAITNHSPLRRYYITRNTLLIAKKHFLKSRRKSLGYIKGFLYETLNLLRFETDRINKFKYILLGVVHFLIGRKGRIK